MHQEFLNALSLILLHGLDLLPELVALSGQGLVYVRLQISSGQLK